jgi:predicted Zn-dependent peptidase
MKHRVFEHHVAGGASGLVIDVPGSDVVNLQVRFNSGYEFAQRSKYEVPHVMEHLLATVTKAHPGPNEFNIEVQKNGAYMNASTSVEANGYIYEWADFETGRLLDLVEEQLTKPLFAQGAFRAEVGNVREELTRNTTQHGAVCGMALAERVFPHLWMSYEERIAQLAQLELADVREHYERTHTAANGRFYVSGSFGDGGEKVVARLDRIFRQLPAGERRICSHEVGRGLERPVLTERDIAQLYYRVSLYFGELTEAERRALTLLRMVLVGGMGSRVYGEARRRGLAYSVSGTGHAEPGNSSFGFAGYVTPDNAEALFELMVREMRAVRAGKLTRVELEAAQDLIIGSVKRSIQTAGDLLGWYLGPYDETGEIRDLDRNLELMRAVRPEEVVAVAEKAAAAKRRGISLLGKLEGTDTERWSEKLKHIC